MFRLTADIVKRLQPRFWSFSMLGGGRYLDIINILTISTLMGFLECKLENLTKTEIQNK